MFKILETPYLVAVMCFHLNTFPAVYFGIFLQTHLKTACINADNSKYGRFAFTSLILTQNILIFSVTPDPFFLILDFARRTPPFLHAHTGPVRSASVCAILTAAGAPRSLLRRGYISDRRVRNRLEISADRLCPPRQDNESFIG